MLGPYINVLPEDKMITEDTTLKDLQLLTKQHEITSVEALIAHGSTYRGSTYRVKLSDTFGRDFYGTGATLTEAMRQAFAVVSLKNVK